MPNINNRVEAIKAVRVLIANPNLESGLRDQHAVVKDIMRYAVREFCKDPEAFIRQFGPLNQ